MPTDPLAITLEHHRAGRLRQAEAGYNAILDSDPGNPEAMHWLGVLAYQVGRHDKAIPLLEQAAAIRPKDAAFQHNLAQAYLTIDQPADAIKTLRKSAEVDPLRSETWMALALAHRSVGDTESAMLAFEKTIATGLDSADVHYHLAVTLLAANRIAETIAESRRAISRRNDFAEAHQLLAVALVKSGNNSEAKTVLQKVMELRPDYARAVHTMGVIEANLGNYPAAEAMFRKALTIDPDYAAAHHALGQVLQQIGRTPEAYEAFRKAVVSDRGRSRAKPAAGGTLSNAVAAMEAKLSAGEADGLHFALAMYRDLAPPAKVPTQAVTDLFDRYAPRFDDHLRNQLKYRVPELIAEIVAATYPGGHERARLSIPSPGTSEEGKGERESPVAPLDILDLGCGTGLVGLLLKPIAGQIWGIDLSPKMIEQARARNVYDHLEVGDMVESTRLLPRSFDLVIAADVFVYVGDLTPAFEAVNKVLRPGGRFIFSVESAPGDRFFLHKQGRYAHSADYLRRVAAMHGFVEESFREIVVRTEVEVPVAGFLVGLRK